MPTTIFLDIDGTLLRQERAVARQLADGEYPEPLPGTIEKLLEWDSMGYQIILVTGRRECWRAITERHLAELGIFYDQLVMQVGNGTRVLINDIKPYDLDKDTAVAVNLPRNHGIAGLSV